MESIEGIIDNLMYLSPSRELLYVTDTNNGQPSGKLEHLSCFLGGLLALGAATIPNAPPRHRWAAEGLGHTCWLMYADQPTSLAPDEIQFNLGSSPTLWIEALALWEAAGSVGEPPGTGQALPVHNASETEYSLRRKDYLLRYASSLSHC
jgi:hypothetical protein